MFFFNNLMEIVKRISFFQHGNPVHVEKMRLETQAQDLGLPLLSSHSEKFDDGGTKIHYPIVSGLRGLCRELAKINSLSFLSEILVLILIIGVKYQHLIRELTLNGINGVAIRYSISKILKLCIQIITMLGGNGLVYDSVEGVVTNLDNLPDLLGT